jgi:hypothetical protein
MEIEIDPRIHARIIGSGGSKLQQIMKEYQVDIKFQTDKVHVIGLDQNKIDACIDHLLVLEEDFLQDLPHRPVINTQNSNEGTHGQQLTNTQQQEVPIVTNVKINKNKPTRQAPFQVKNAPWTNGNEYENEYQKKNSSRQRNGHDNSPKKSTAPNLNDLGKILFCIERKFSSVIFIS